MGKKQRRKNRSLVQAAVARQPFLVKAIGICAILALAVPLLKRPHWYFASYYTQFTVMQLVVEFMLALWLILIVKDKRYRPDWRNPVVVGLLAFIGTMVIALPFAIDPTYSFWSRPTRMTGVVNYLHFAAYLFVLVSTFKKPEHYRKLLVASSVVATIVGAIGIQDWLGNPGKTVQSMMSNPSFFGIYMLLHVFIGVYLLAGARDVRSRLLPVATIAVSVFTVFLSGSRGSVLTLFTTAIIGAVVYFLRSSVRRAHKIAAVMAALLIVISATTGFIFLRSDQMRGWVNENLSGAFHRLVTRDFGSDRWMLWSYGLQGAMERPVFGWGMEQYEVSYFKFYDPSTKELEIANEQYADRAHNQYLDVLIASGIFGLIGYLAFLLLLFWAAWTKIKNSADPTSLVQSIALLSVLVAYCTYGLIMFDTPMAVMVSFLAYAAIAANYRQVKNVPEQDVGFEISNNGLALATPILVVMVVVALLVNIMPARKIYQIEEAVKLTDSNRTAALDQYKMATQGYSPYDIDLRLRLVTKLKKWSENVSLRSGQLNALIEYLTPLMEQAADKRSYNMRFQLAAAASFRMLGDYNSNALDIAKEYAQSVIEQAPGRSEAYIEHAETDIVRGDGASAAEHLLAAEARVPLKNKHVLRYVYFRLASAYAVMCDHESSERYFTMAAEGGHPHHKDTRFLLDLDRYCRSDADFTWVEDHVDKLLVVYPDHPQVLPAAARIYKMANQPGKVAEMIKRLDQRNPSAAAQLAEELGLTNDAE